jgi:hypothetical protein
MYEVEVLPVLTVEELVEPLAVETVNVWLPPEIPVLHDPVMVVFSSHVPSPPAGIPQECEASGCASCCAIIPENNIQPTLGPPKLEMK